LYPKHSPDTSSLFWALLPSTLFFVILSSENVSVFATHPSHSRLLLLWNPIVALSSTYPASSGIEWIYFILGLGSDSNNGANAAIYRETNEVNTVTNYLLQTDMEGILLDPVL
jgi:hypothetical protein